MAGLEGAEPGARSISLLEGALGRTGDVIHLLHAEAMATPSMCERWSVADVVAHVVAVTEKFTAFANGDTDRPRQAALRAVADPARAYDDAAAASRAAWRSNRDALERTCHLAFGDFDGGTAAGINMFDALLHGWDIAAAVGVLYEPDDDACNLALDIARRLVTPASRAQGHYAPATRRTQPTPFARLLAVTGRAAEP
jgi:uncharacterized protein (TIGR03086 family)